MRDARVVEILSRVDLNIDTKADFADKSNLEPLVRGI